MATIAIQSFPLVGVDTSFTGRIIVPWNKGKFPSTASAAAVTASATSGLAIPFGAGQASITETYALFEWTSTANASQVTAGAEVAVGQILRKSNASSPTNAQVFARIQVNDADRISAIYLGLNDENGNNASTALGSFPTSWSNESSGTKNISTWGDLIGVTIVVQGTTDKNKVGLTQFYIDYLAVEFS